MLLQQVAGFKKFCFKYRIWMIKAKQAFFSSFNLECHGFNDNKANILYLTRKYDSLSVVSEKLYFLEISSVNQKLWSFKSHLK